MAIVDRRNVLKGLGLVGCSLAAHPLATRISLASVPGEARLVVIVLRGGMDGLDVLRPVGDPGFEALRGGLPSEPGLALDGFYELHPALEDLLPLWSAGELGFAQAVSTPYRDKRSHFDGQDILEAGGGDPATVAGARGGWLNRLLTGMPGAHAETAFAVGREAPLILAGEAPVQLWSPEARLTLSPQARLLLEHIYQSDPAFRTAAARAMDLAETLEEEGADPAGRAGPAEIARFAAGRLAGESRIAAFSLGGWDTHRNQRGALARALGQLATSLLALREGLGPVWQNITVLAMTEFGRTAAANGTGGTDHGTGGLMLMAGGAIRGGQVLGGWPGLSEADLYDRRDLMPLEDVRRYAAWALRGSFGVSETALGRDVFPGLDIGAEPGLLR